MTPLLTHLFSAFLFASTALSALAEPRVVASIKPVHSLVSAVMEGVGTPELIVEGAGSPHGYAMKPSQAKKLEQADLVFWIGSELERFLEKPIKTIAGKARSVQLITTPNLDKLSVREGGPFEKHEDNHVNDAHHHKEEHSHGQFDVHVWLDPQNAKALVNMISDTLIKADPANAGKYTANTKAVLARLDALTGELSSMLEPVKGKRFVVFHDAYQYFEKRFGMYASGSITVSPEAMPGVERIKVIKRKVRQLGATCIFAEPQFEPKLVTVVAEGTQAKTGTLDPLGAEIPKGPDLYFTLIRNMAVSMRDCLSAKK